MTKILNLSLIPLLILHLWLSAQFELSHDEAYYWLYSHNLDWGFFDHPPAVGIIIKLFSFLPKSEFSVRAGFVILQFASSLLLLSLVSKNRQLIALILFFAFPLASFSGLFALPDLPLLFMTTAYCALLKRYLEKGDTPSIVGLGVAIPLLLYSKYHGILVVFFTLLALPKIFRRKDFYVVTLISIILFVPHVTWQYQHNFSTLRYHFLERPKVDFSLMRLLEYSGAQVFLAGLFVGPVVWWSVVKAKMDSDFQRAMKFICLGTFLFFFASTFSKKFEANWTIFLTAPLIILGSGSNLWTKTWVRILLGVSLGCVFFLRFLLVSDPSVVKIKRLHEFHGWTTWSQTILKKCQNPLVANTYQLASKLSFYLNLPIHALNYHSRKNQFDYWQLDANYYQTDMVCFVSDKKDFGGEVVESPEGKKLFLVQALSLSKIRNKNP